MSEQDLDEIVQITVEEFNQDDRTGKILVKQCYYQLLLFHYDYINLLHYKNSYLYANICTLLYYE